MLKITVAMTALLAAVSLPSQAQTVIKSCSGSLKRSISYSVDPDGSTANFAHAWQVGFKHSFTLTPEEELALATNTTVQVDGFDLLQSYQFSEDPKYQPGNTSVSIKRVEENPESVQTTAVKMKWSKGVFSISVSVKSRGTAVSTVPKPATKAPGHPSATESVQTTLVGTTASSTAYVSVDAKQSENSFINPDGSYGATAQESLKSKALVDAPIIWKK